MNVSGSMGCGWWMNVSVRGVNGEWMCLVAWGVDGEWMCLVAWGVNGEWMCLVAWGVGGEWMCLWGVWMVNECVCLPKIALKTLATYGKRVAGATEAATARKLMQFRNPFIVSIIIRYFKIFFCFSLPCCPHSSVLTQTDIGLRPYEPTVGRTAGRTELMWDERGNSISQTAGRLTNNGTINREHWRIRVGVGLNPPPLRGFFLLVSIWPFPLGP